MLASSVDRRVLLFLGMHGQVRWFCRLLHDGAHRAVDVLQLCNKLVCESSIAITDQCAVTPETY
jgi:hypothetical protein